MKLVFKCDYCSEMGTEEEIREHEVKCTENYDRKSCHTCVHKKIRAEDKQLYYECKVGNEIPEGKFFEFCKSYERKEKANNLLDYLFDGLL